MATLNGLNRLLYGGTIDAGHLIFPVFNNVWKVSHFYYLMKGFFAQS